MRLSAYRPALAAIACAAVAGALLAGCGDESGPDAEPAPSSGGPGTTAPPPDTPSAGPALPLTISRNGGIAGFADRVVLGADGVASITRRGAVAERCRVEGQLLGTITTAAGGIDWPALGSVAPAPQHPDDLVVAVTARGGTARLTDPRVSALADPVGRLLADATAPAANRTLCRPA